MVAHSSDFEFSNQTFFGMFEIILDRIFTDIATSDKALQEIFFSFRFLQG